MDPTPFTLKLRPLHKGAYTEISLTGPIVTAPQLPDIRKLLSMLFLGNGYPIRVVLCVDGTNSDGCQAGGDEQTEQRRIAVAAQSTGRSEIFAQLRGIVRAAFAWWQQQGPRKPPPASTHALVVAPAAAPPKTTQPVPAPAPAATPPAAAPTRATTYLDLTYQGQPVRFAKTEIDRAHLYGVRKLIALDAEGRECQSALLTRDGRYVLPAGSTADLYINECGDAVSRRELVAAGAPLSALPPTANVPPAIEGPLSVWELLDYAVTRAYALHSVALPAKLAQALTAGALFRVPYHSRPTSAETPAFLLGSQAGAFLLQAEPHGFDFVSADQPALPESDPDEDDIDAFAFPGDFGGHNDPA